MDENLRTGELITGVTPLKRFVPDLTSAKVLLAASLPLADVVAWRTSINAF